MTNGKEKRDQKNVLIGTLLAAVLIMAIGYAALAQRLTINGTATISSEWNIAITNAEEATGEKVGNPVVSGIDHTTTTATFNVGFTTPGESTVIDVTVHNGGTLDAELESIQITPSEEESKLKFEVIGVSEGDPLTQGQDQVVKVKVTFEDDGTGQLPTVKTNTATIILNYVQA